jgi:hypothetical protein
MNPIDLTVVAQRARAAGRSAEQFVRACFEGDPAIVRTPAPGGPVPVPYPNVAVARRSGGLPDVQKASSPQSGAFGLIGAAGREYEAALEYMIIAAGRALTGNWDEHLALTAAMLDSLKDARAPIGKSLGNFEMSRREAFRQVVTALRSEYGVDARTALEVLLRQAQRTFGWPRREVGVALQAVLIVVEITVVIVQAVMIVFGLSAEGIALMAVRVVLAVIGTVVVVFLAVIAVSSYGTAPIARGALALIAGTAAEPVIVRALSILLTVGVVVSAIVQIEIELMGRGPETWAGMVCEAWRTAEVRTISLVGLVTELSVSLQLVELEKVNRMLAKLQADLNQVADVITAVFGRDPGPLARALRAAHASWIEIATLIRAKLGSDVATIARELKNLGADAHEVSVAIQGAGF